MLLLNLLSCGLQFRAELYFSLFTAPLDSQTMQRLGTTSVSSLECLGSGRVDQVEGQPHLGVPGLWCHVLDQVR